MDKMRIYWNNMASYGPEASVIDPLDRRGKKNAYIKYVRDSVLEKFADSLNKPCSVLDFGCGTGNISALFAQRSHRAVGMDISYNLLRMAKDRESLNGHLLLCYDGERFPLASNTFDAVSTYVVLSHILDDHQMVQTLDEIYRVMKPGAEFIAIEPTRRNVQLTPGELQKRRTRQIYVDAFDKAGLPPVAVETIRTGHFPLIYLIRFGIIPRSLFPTVKRIEQLYCKTVSQPLFDYADTVFHVRKPQT